MQNSATNNTERGDKAEDKDASPFNFTAFILSMSSSAMLNLGEAPDPATGHYNVNLPLAKQSIDIVVLLKEKTKGNLTSDEESLMSNVLYELRIKYADIYNRNKQK